VKKQRTPAPSAKPDSASPDQPVVRISDVSFSYPNQPALAGVSINASKGEIVGVLGPNGSGKSTLFRILSTLMVPSGGSVEIDGIDIVRSPDLGRQRTGIVFQSSGLDAKLTVLENLTFHGHFHGIGGSLLVHRVEHLMKAFGLLERKNDLVETLSGGLQRRVELARGILHQPAVLILDEPSTGLDPAGRLDFWQFLTRAAREDGTTILLTTHLLEEADTCDQVIIMDQGRVVVSGSPSDLKASLGGDVVVIEARDPERLAKRIKKEFQVQGTIIDGRIQLETTNGSRLISRLSKTLEGFIESMTIRKSGLQDVFLHKTGHRLATHADTEGQKK
jgi:ABC-2 type transport system ATP-binding protein